MKRTAAAIGAMCALVVTLIPSAAAVGTLRAPDGYSRIDSRQPGKGLVTHSLVATSDGADQAINVAVLDPTRKLAVRAVQSHDLVASPARERTSSMCGRVGCLVAVNGDFAQPGTGTPVGGLVIGGELLRTPTRKHHQASFRPDGTFTTEPIRWTAIAMTTDFRPIGLNGINVPRPRDGIVAYTHHYGSRTPTSGLADSAELVLTIPSGVRPLSIGGTAAVEVKRLRDKAGASTLSADQMVLSARGSGAIALRRLWSRIQRDEAGRTLLVRITGPRLTSSVGASHVIVKGAKVSVSSKDRSTLARGRHPRTLIGRNRAGHVLMVTVDGRQDGYARGMTLREAARLMRSLGAVEAVNLDGGGSTTFVRRNKVVNRPSDRLVLREGAQRLAAIPSGFDDVVGHVERPVVNALVVVTKERAKVPPPQPPRPADIDAPVVTPGEKPPAEVDPASNVFSALPALVYTPPPVEGPAGIPPLAIVALVFLSLVVGALARHRVADHHR